jgi:hypothetical protein
MKSILLFLILASSALAGKAVAQQEDSRKALVGEWTLVSASIRQDSLGVLSSIPYQLSQRSQHRWAIYTPLKFAANGDCDLTLDANLVEEGTFTTMDDQLDMTFDLLSVNYTYRIESGQLHLNKRMASLRGYPAVEVFFDIHITYQLKLN